MAAEVGIFSKRAVSHVRMFKPGLRGASVERAVSIIVVLAESSTSDAIISR